MPDPVLFYLVTSTHADDGNTQAALRSIAARTLVLAPRVDLFNPSDVLRHATGSIRGGVFVEIASIQGHQAATPTDANDAAFLNRTIARFLEEAS